MAIRKFNSIGGFSVGEIGNTHDVINNVGNVTANNLTVTNNTNLGNVGNVKITGGTSGFVLKTDGSGNLTWVDPLASGLSGSDTQIQFNDNGSLGSSSQLTFAKSTNTFTTVNIVADDIHSNSATIDGNISAGNVVGGNLVSANYIAGTLTTHSQPNITSVGTLTSLTVEGDTSITGNLKVQGTFDYVNSTVTYVSDPIVEQGGGANGAALTTDDMRDRGALLHYYHSSQAVDAFMGWDNSNGEFSFGSNVAVDDNIVTFNELGNIRANVVFANIEGALLTSSQPSITSVGTLDNLTVSGGVSAEYFLGPIANGQSNVNIPAIDGNVNIVADGNTTVVVTPTGANVSGYLTVSGNIKAGNADLGNLAIANYITGTLTTNAQPNITSVGTLSSLSVTGNISSGNADLGNLVTANYFTGTLTTNAQPNITSVGTLSELNVTSNITASGILTDNLYYANGNPWDMQQPAGSNTEIVFNDNGSFGASASFKFDKESNTLTAGNKVTTGVVEASGNISSLNANLGNLATANYFTGTLTTNAQPNITSVGELDGLVVTGDTTITGNLVVTGTAQYANISSFIVKDPIIEQGGNVDGALTSNDGKDRGQLLHYYTTDVVDAFMGWDNSNGEFAFGSNVTVDSDIVTFNELATVRAGQYISTSAVVDGTLTTITLTSVNGSFSDGISTANATIANAIIDTAVVSNLNSTTANISGTLTVDGNLVVNGTTTFVNSTTVNYVDPVIQLNGNPDGSSLTYNDGQDIGVRVEYFDSSAKSGFFGRKNSSGYFEYLTNISEISGVITGDYGAFKGLTYISTATTGTAPFIVSSTTRVANLNSATAGVAETVSSAAQPNITSVGTLISANVTGNIKAGNANLGNLATANFFSGNGSALTYITGANVVGQVANANVANTILASSQPNITSVGTLTSLTVNGTTDLGLLRDVHISGGASGYYLTTNGAGDLTWAPATSSGDAKFVSMIKRDYVADGSTFVYTLPTTPVTQEAVSVNIDGLMQTQSVYTVLGAEVHFVTAPIAGQIVEFTVYGVVDISGNDGEIYFSDQGQIGSDANLAFNKTTGQLTANGFTGNGYHLHHINSANIVGGINSALSAIYSDTAGSADTVTGNDQPNITSVGTLTGLSIAGHIIPAADITYDLGNTTRRFRDLHLSGQTIQLGDSTLQTVGDTLVLTNPIGGQFIVDGSNAAYATLASYVTESNQSNITQLGSLVTLDVSGDLANGYAGDVTASGNVTSDGNITINGGSLTIGTSMIAVDSGNAGIFNLGVSNVSIGRQANVILSTSGKTTDVKGMLHVTGDMTTDSDISTNTLNAGYVATSDGEVTGTLTANKIKVGDLYSSRLPIEITTDTPIDSFDPLTYRSAKYTIRVNSDDGYQAAEVLLIHDGADAYVTIYGSLSTIGLDIASFRAEITGGLVTLYATTNSGTTTTVNLLGTYVAD